MRPSKDPLFEVEIVSALGGGVKEYTIVDTIT